MSIKLMSLVWVYAGEDLSPSEALVLLSYADFADGQGAQAWPAYATVAQRTKLSCKSVMRAAQTLGEKGFLRRMPGRSRYGTLRFQIVADRLLAGDTESLCADQEGTQSPTPGDTESPHRGQGVPQSTKTPQRTGEEAAAGELVLDDTHIPQVYHDRASADGWGEARIRQEWEMFVLWHQEKGTVPATQSETPWLRLWAKWRRRSRAHDPVLPGALPPAEALQSPLIAEARALANMG